MNYDTDVLFDLGIFFLGLKLSLITFIWRNRTIYLLLIPTYLCQLRLQFKLQIYRYKSRTEVMHFEMGSIPNLFIVIQLTPYFFWFMPKMKMKN